MERKPLLKRLLAGTLAVAVTVSSLTFSSLAAEDVNGTKLSFREVSNDAVSAALPGRETMSSGSEKAPYADNETVRVSIVLGDKSTIANGFEVKDIAQNTAAMSYRAELQAKQDNVVTKIEKATGEDLDVVWKLTLAANLISANVEYGQIETIEKIKGVKEVLIETQYQPDVISEKPATDPNMATSSAQIGSGLAWAAGYTGAGSRIAIVDTGTDTDHQSFAEAGFLHSLEVNAEKKGMTVEAYMATLNLLTKEEIDSVKDQLNVGQGKFTQEGGAIDPEKAYLTQKLPYAFSYVDNDYDITHDNDNAGEHGSHVAGIATANSYIQTADGFEPALTYAHTQGVAPDAQLLTMKVFGNAGGAYDSDYMAAIEDAIVLKADSINLSLGSGNPGNSRNSTAAYQAIMESLSESGVVVAMSAGNSGHWAEEAENLTGNLYADDVSMQTDGSPGSYTNSFTVASIDNIGFTGTYIEAADGSVIFYTESPSDEEDGYDSFTTLKGEQPYILIDGYGRPEDWAALEGVLEGKIAVCSRGGIDFTAKGNNAVESGAIATIVYNNTSGTINMLGDGYNYRAPYLAITQADGAILKANAEKKTTADGTVYYEGTLVSHDDVVSMETNAGSTMSSFSSWGVPGSLQLKPEITAPGGDIYSVNGLIQGGTSYENMSGTSMASPQIAGMSAVAAQYVREEGLEEKTGLSARTLIQSLLMSTAEPVFESVPVAVDEETGDYIYGEFYYPVLRQGAGLANISNLLSAASYILMGEDATVSADDGKVKAELGDDPDRKGEYTFSFSINNITDDPVAYNLSADLFTQGYYVYYVSGDVDEDGNITNGVPGYYMDTATMDMESDAVFECDGETVTTVMVPANGSTTVTVTLTLSEAQKAELDAVFENGAYVEGFVFATPAKSYDFNNDGKVDEDDAQAILDYRTTLSDKLYNKENADFDDDGDIDTRDAYLFLEALANGDIDLGEGVEGVAHSIPVLGFYGNWSDPSMFEKGTLLDYYYGNENRFPYLGDDEANSFGLTYAGESDTYPFGGNPFIGTFLEDEEYYLDRNAINSNDFISMVSFAAIRNAADTLFTVEKAGETVYSTSFGEEYAAYYYANQGVWRNTSDTKKLDFVPSEHGLKDGDKITLNMILVPEYYVDDEGNVNADALGDGAYMSIPAVVDDTAPRVLAAVYNEDEDTLTITADDNQYIAAVMLYNRQGTSLIDAVGSVSDIEAGKAANFDLSTVDVKGKKFLVQVIDYAFNITTYEVYEDVGSKIEVPDLMAYNSMFGYWFSIIDDPEYEGDKTWEIYTEANHDYIAATIAEHYIYAVDSNGGLYVMPEDDLDNFTYINDVPVYIYDMAYNPADGELYGIAVQQGQYGFDSYLVNIDKLTGKVKPVGMFYYDLTVTLACDEDGIFYYNPLGEDSIYSFTLGDLVYGYYILGNLLCDSTGIGESDAYDQAMEINPNTGALCWISANSDEEMIYVEVDTETGEATMYNDLYFDFNSLVIPDKTNAPVEPEWIKPATAATDVVISDSSIEMFKNTTTTLSANVVPWTLTDRSVKWTSSDETIAKVDENGVVTALKDGECVITAASSVTGTVKDTCTVVVKNMAVTLSGALQDTESKAQFYEWNVETDETWTAGVPFSNFTGDISVATASDKYVYVLDGDNVYHQIDPATGETLKTGDGFKNAGNDLILFDMAYSEAFSTKDADAIVGVYGPYVFGPTDPLNFEDGLWNDAQRLASAGASHYIAITAMGNAVVNITGLGATNCERYFLLDNIGDLWTFCLITDEGDYYAARTNPQLLGKLSLPSNFLGSNKIGEYCSLVGGDDGYLYFSAFDGDTNNFYCIDLNTGKATYINNVGEGVWPAALLKAEANVKAAALYAESSTASFENLLKASSISCDELEMASAGTFAVKATRSAKPAKHVKTVSTAKSAEKATRSANCAEVLKQSASILAGDNEVETTLEGYDASVNETTVKLDSDKDNGLFLINYDPEVLTLTEENIEINAEYTSFKLDAENGKLIVGYVYGDSDADILVLNFDVNSDTTATSTIVNVVNAEVGELDIIPVDVVVSDYDLEKDGISDSAGVSEEDVNELLAGEIEIKLPEPPTTEPPTTEPPTTEPPTTEPSTSEPEVSEPSGTTAPDVTAPGGDDNKPTGFAFCLVPAAVSAIAVLASKKRRK